MEDHTLHTNTHSRSPPPTPSTVGRSGREEKVSGCSSLWIPGAARVEVCSMLSPVIARPGQPEALFTGADTPGAAERPNCFTASLSCVMRSLLTWISSQREIKGQRRGTLPLSTFKNNPACTQQRTDIHTNTNTLLYEVWAERSLIAWLDQNEYQRELKHATQH